MTTTDEIIPPEVEAQDKTAHELVNIANSIVITTHEDAQWVADFLHDVKDKFKLAYDTLEPIPKAQYATFKFTRARVDAVYEPFKAATKKAKDLLDAWIYEQKRIETAALEARQREAELAERARRDEEAKIAAEAIKAQREAAAAAKRAGDEQTAARLREEAAQAAALQRELAAQPIVAVVEAAPEPAKVKGISTRTSWKIRVTNPLLIPDRYMKTIPDENFIEKEVNEMRGNITIPGVEITVKNVVVTR